MSGFEQSLRRYLEGLARPVEPPRVHIDDGALRAHFLATLHEHEPAAAEVHYQAWSERLVPFARFLESRPEIPTDVDQASLFARRLVSSSVGAYSYANTVERLEADRIFDGFHGATGGAQDYAVEVQLVRPAEQGVALSRIGTAFLRLRGLDAVRWLLLAEVLQSTGDYDRFRCSRQLLAEALGDGIELGRGKSRYTPETLERLRRLDVLASDFETGWLGVPPAFRGVVEATVNGSSWDAVVSAMLEDQRSEAIGSLSTASASETTLTQTRLITHEIRNALVPSRHHLDAVLANDPDVLGRAKAAQRGVTRVLSFVEELVTSSELLEEPTTQIELNTAVAEARTWVDDEDRVEVVRGPNQMIAVPRQRFIRAVANVVRNALQATADLRAPQGHLVTRPPQILIVDDDRDFVAIYRDLFDADGLAVTVAHTHDDATRVLEGPSSREIDVVLLDQKLQGPGGPDSGLELIQRIANLAPLAKTIVVTGYATADAIERAFRLDVYDYIVKNGAFEALVRAKVRNAIEVSRAQRLATSDRSVIDALKPTWDDVRSATDRNRKGLLLEELVKLLSRATPGFERVRTRLNNKTEEIDIVVENRSTDALWQKDTSVYLLGECKNWNKPCGSAELRNFFVKLQTKSKRASTGFFIAPGGFTTEFDAARAELKLDQALIIPVGAADLQDWIDTDDRVDVLRALHHRAVFGVMP